MAYHETFWVVTGTEAPVVALAVIVQMGDVIQAIDRDKEQPWAQNERYSTAMAGVLVVGVLNLALMGWLLFSSLSTLAAGTDGLSTDWATAQAVGGLGLLALVSVGAFAVRYESRDVAARAGSGDDGTDDGGGTS